MMTMAMPDHQTAEQTAADVEGRSLQVRAGERRGGVEHLAVRYHGICAVLAVALAPVTYCSIWS